jgi:CDP-diacylglycerol--glycerol-3-phosphate 3-phosphatidyltransferase
LLPHDRLFKRFIEPYFPPWIRPNHLTVARFVLTPFVVLVLAREDYRLGVPLFVLTALTDAFDGSLARVRRQITEWGIIYDPLADKLLIGSVLAVIVLQHINPYLGVGLLVIETGMIIGGWYGRRQGRVEPANVWGKIKMVAEVVGIGLLLIALWSKADLLVDLSAGTLALALVVAIVSIFSRLK